MIVAEIRAPDPGIAPHWGALARRAAANVFLSPAALSAVSDSGFARVHMLLAWDKSAAEDKLVGVWALREQRIAPFWPAILAAPSYEYCFVSSPVIDPDYIDAVMPAFFDAIARSSLPNVIQLKLLDGDAATFVPMMAALNARQSRMLTLSERPRPFLGGESERKRSGSTAKKLRQDWNKLSALGAVDVANDRSPDDVRDAFEVFLTLEAQSWKGASGTALLSHDKDAAFARRLIGNLAERGNASVAHLRINGRPIAAQVLLYGGSMAYTWKTAFDAEFGKFSPGSLLIDKVTDDLFASGIESIESCSAEGSFMEHLWTGRRMTVDMLVDIGTEKSIGFTLAAMGERAYAWLRGARNWLRDVSWLPKRKSLAVTRS